MRIHAIAAAAFLASCVAYTPKPIDATANARTIQQTRIDTPEVRAAVERTAGHAIEPWPPQRWTLDELTAASFQLDPKIAVARAEYATARAAMLTASERPNPVANASVEHKPSSSEPSPWVTNFGVDLPLELPAKRRARMQQAAHAANAALARVSAVAWETRSRIRVALVDMWSAQQREAALRRELDIENDIVEIFSKRVQYGEASQPELSRARIALGQTTLLLRDAARAARLAHAAAATAIGVPETAIGAFDLAPLDATPSIDNALRDSALVARPDIRAALEDYAAADEALRLEIARQYPDLHIGPGFGWDQGTRTWLLAASAELPILNRHRGPIAEASARRDEAAARFNALQSSVLGAFDSSRIAVDAARQKLADADALVAAERANVDTVRRQFEAGEIDRLALRSAELELEAANLGRADAATELQQAIGALEDAVEQPLSGSRR